MSGFSQMARLSVLAQAHNWGYVSALGGGSRKVPPRFSMDEDLAAEWLRGYDEQMRILQELRLAPVADKKGAPS